MHICFIGCGEITARHANRLRGIDSSLSLSFASRSKESSEAYRKKYGGVYAFGSYAEASTHEDIDVIMINTPPHLHLELTEEGLKGSKHIIVEKPPFFHASDFESVGPLADRIGKQLCVAENYYYKPLRSTLARLLKEEVIGQPLFMHLNATKLQKPKGDWRADVDLVKHGALYEGGIHWISLINNLGLHVEHYSGYQPIKSDRLEKSMQATAQTKEGLIINMIYSWETPTIAQGLRISKIHGTRGSITFETNGLWILVRGTKKRLIIPGLRDIQGTGGMFTDFLEAIRTGRAPKYDWRKAQRDLHAVELIYESSRNRTPNI